MHDALRANVHVRARCHLPVLRNAHRIHPLPIVWFRIIRYHHSIGHDHTGCVFVRWKQSHRMAAVHRQRLVFGHLTEVLHRQPVLRPVLKNPAVSAISDELLGVLRHSRIQVVLNHQHDGSRLLALGRVLLNGTSKNRVLWAQSVHVYAAIILELLCELRGQNRMCFYRKITQRVAQCQFLFCRRQNVFPDGCVAHLLRTRKRRRQFSRNSF